MSHFMTALAMKQPGLKPAAKIVLYWLADHHNETTGECFPSINRLADLCEMSRRSVEVHLGDLEARGLIARQARHRDGGGKTANGYILRLSGRDAQNLRMPPAKSAHGDAQNLRMNNLGRNNLGNEQETSDHRAAAIEADSPDQGDLTPVVEPPLGGAIGSEVAKAAGGLREGCRTLDDEFERVWEHYPRKVGKGAARKAWAKARRQATYAEITGPLGVWIKLQRGTPVEKIPHFTTWLNQERWHDDQTHARNRAETTTDRLNRLGAVSTEDQRDAITGPRRKPPQIELRMDP